MSRSNRHRTFGLLAAAGLLALSSGLSAQPEELTVIFEKPGVDLRPYRQVLVKPLNLADTRLVPPPWVENPDPKLWTLTRDNQDFLRAAFQSSVRTGIEESGQFRVVSSPTPGTLQLEVHLISLTPWAARGEDVETLGSGTLTFEAHVRDAQTADLLAVFEGTQQVGREYQENTEFNKATSLMDHFSNWGRNVSRRLAARQTR